jgi:tetratricopeptide (TPR) repeat protein
MRGDRRNEGGDMKEVFLFMAIIVLFVSCVYKPKEEVLINYAKAKNLYSEGRFQEAAAILAAENRFPPALTLRGKAEYFLDENDKAEKTLRKVLKIRPSAIEASLYLVRILQEKGKTDEAQALIEALLSDDPSNIRVLRLAASFSPDNAQTYLDRAVEASAETALVFLDRARLKWIAGNGNQALEDLERAKSLINDSSSPLFRAINNLEKAIKTGNG